MTIVVDANLLVVLALDDERAPLVEAKMREWGAAGETLHAPALMPYEAANAVLRVAVAGGLEPSVVAEIWATLAAVPVTLHPLDSGADVIAIARRLGRQSAYGSAYVALAEAVGSELWTLDGPLARNAANAGLPVKLMLRAFARAATQGARVDLVRELGERFASRPDVLETTSATMTSARGSRRSPVRSSPRPRHRDGTSNAPASP